MAKKEPKPKEPKVYICHYCSEPIENNLVEFEMGKKTVIKKRAHEKCRTNKLKRDEYYQYILKILDLSSNQVPEWFWTGSEGHNKMYGWDTMIHAAKTKKNVIIDNFDKGWSYMLGIIKNQLPISQKAVKQQLLIQQQKEKIRLQKEQVNNNIIRVSVNQPSSQLLELDDISTL
jgi:hypothetical protein